MHNNDRTHPVPDFLHMERIHYSCVSSSVSSYGWMKLCFLVVFFLEEAGWGGGGSLFENSAAQHAETSPSLTSGQQGSANLETHWPRLFYFIFSADALSREEDYCAFDKSL